MPAPRWGLSTTPLNSIAALLHCRVPIPLMPAMWSRRHLVHFPPRMVHHVYWETYPAKPLFHQLFLTGRVSFNPIRRVLLNRLQCLRILFNRLTIKCQIAVKCLKINFQITLKCLKIKYPIKLKCFKTK